MIEVRGLNRRYGAHTAIADLDFSIERGEVVGFLGPNGAGKTTTLRILAGYLPASSGAASVAGYDVLRDSLQVRRRIGYLPESVPLYPEHRVSEMLRFQANLHGLSRKEAKERIPAVLERVGISDRERQPIGQLSRGLRQRVGLAVALLPDPEVLLLDEPTSGLDPLQRIEVRKLIADLKEDRTVLLSSHILPEIEAICPRVIILHEGHIAADGTHEELVHQLGSPSHVRVEVMVPDAAEAARLLGQLPGVQKVNALGREFGIHEQFEVFADQDLREDIGSLAMTRSWALRELSFQQPSLEELFAKIALGLGSPSSPTEAENSASSSTTVAELQPTRPESTSGLNLLTTAPEPKTSPDAAKPAPSKMRTLSPFENFGSPKKATPPGGDSGEA